MAIRMMEKEIYSLIKDEVSSMFYLVTSRSIWIEVQHNSPTIRNP